jgi:hypothetical protein
MMHDPNWEENLRGLEANWDSYGAYPISEKAIAVAKDLIERINTFYVLPTVNGGVALSWFTKEDEFTLEIFPSGKPYED